MKGSVVRKEKIHILILGSVSVQYCWKPGGSEPVTKFSFIILINIFVADNN